MVKYNIIIYVIILKSKYGALIFQFLYYQTWYTFFFFFNFDSVMHTFSLMAQQIKCFAY